MSLLLTILTACGALAAPTPEQRIASAAEKTVLGQWGQLLEAECDLARATITPIWLPSQARVLRNTPYALRGRRFQSQELQRFFAAMDWYEPAHDEVVVPDDELVCVTRLAEREQALRSELTLPAEVEAAMTAPEFLVPIFAAVGETPRGPGENWERFEAEGAWWWCDRQTDEERKALESLCGAGCAGPCGYGIAVTCRSGTCALVGSTGI